MALGNPKHWSLCHYLQLWCLLSVVNRTSTSFGAHHQCSPKVPIQLLISVNTSPQLLTYLADNLPAANMGGLWILSMEQHLCCARTWYWMTSNPESCVTANQEAYIHPTVVVYLPMWSITFAFSSYQPTPYDFPCRCFSSFIAHKGPTNLEAWTVRFPLIFSSGGARATVLRGCQRCSMLWVCSKTTSCHHQIHSLASLKMILPNMEPILSARHWDAHTGAQQKLWLRAKLRSTNEPRGVSLHWWKGFSMSKEPTA